MYTYYEHPNPPLHKGHGKRTAPPTEIAVHNTANTATAKGEAEYAANGMGAVSYHYAVDESEVWQIMPDDYTAIHCGDTVGNKISIGVEIARSTNYDTDRYARAEENAALLVAELMTRYGIPIERVKRHHDYSGKRCPHRMFEAEAGKPGRTWQDFRELVQSHLSGAQPGEPAGGGASMKQETIYRVQIGAYTVKENAERMLQRVRAQYPDAYIATSTRSVMIDYAAVAREVLAGKWGNGAERVSRLTAAGYDATAVQAEVNRQLKG